MTKVVFATPSYGAAPAIEYERAAVQTQWLLLNSGISTVWTDLCGDPYVHKARSRLASEFLTNYPDADSLFFLDDDVGWPATAALRLIERPEDIVVGIYPKKRDDVLEFPVEMAMQNGMPVEQDGLFEATLAPTGFMRLKRRVLERCAEDSGRYPETDKKGNTVWCWDLFRTGFVASEPGGKEGRWWGEDFFFSVMVRNLGMRIWVDPDIPFTHRGSKAWSANFSDTLQSWIAQQRPAEAA